MKEHASDLAGQDKVPSMRAALAIVARIISEEHALSTPEEARHYFAEELQRMVRDECRMRSPVR
jgi:hypothetical protein